MQKGEILFRTDGNAQIGLGHIVRCSALAKMLKVNFSIRFYFKNIPDIILFELQESGISCFKIVCESIFFSQLKENTLVVLDGYQFNSDYQKKIKECGSKLICIDDLHEKEFFADLIINHTPGVLVQDYIAQPYTQFALGLDYVLLRPAFLEQAPKRRIIDKIETVMICFGGSDYLDLTQNLLHIVLSFPQFKKIIVVTGSAYHITENFTKKLAGDKRIEFYNSLNEQHMHSIMMESDLAIVPASGILFEALLTGCIVISGYYIDNQKLVYENFKKAMFIIDAGDFSHIRSKNAISSVFNGSITYSTKIFDGQSAQRILKLFNQLDAEKYFKLRCVTFDDLDITYNWATNAEIRRFSFQKHEINKAEHTNWFSSKLNDPNCFYLIMEYKSIPVGSIRFDILENEAIISYLVDSIYHGKGYGTIILKKGIEWLTILDKLGNKPIYVISGKVIKTNLPSIKTFEKLGFTMKEFKDNYKFEKWIRLNH